MRISRFTLPLEVKSSKLIIEGLFMDFSHDNMIREEAKINFEKIVGVPPASDWSIENRYLIGPIPTDYIRDTILDVVSKQLDLPKEA